MKIAIVIEAIKIIIPSSLKDNSGHGKITVMKNHIDYSKLALRWWLEPLAMWTIFTWNGMGMLVIGKELIVRANLVYNWFPNMIPHFFQARKILTHYILSGKGEKLLWSPSWRLQSLHWVWFNFHRCWIYHSQMQVHLLVVTYLPTNQAGCKFLPHDNHL